MRNVSMHRYRFSSPRAGLGSRILVDLFGPLIDISVLEFLRGVPNSRSATLEQIVESLNAGSSTWTIEDVIERLLSALQNWDYYEKLINLPAIDSLNKAIDRDTAVMVLTTTEQNKLANAAQHAIDEAFRRVRGTNEIPDSYRFKQIGKETDAWEKELKALNEHSKRYTYVIHDHHPSEVLHNQQSSERSELLYDEWFGSSDPTVLDKLIEDALEREVRFAPLAWLKKTDEFSLKTYETVGKFLVFDKRTRAHIKEQVEQICQRAQKDGGPATVVLGGPSGSGKSFFANEFIGQYGNKIAPNENQDLAVWDLSSVWDLRAALDEHLHELVAKKSAFALLDEVDTIVDGRASFRFLMRPMSGELPLGSGRGHGIKIPVKVWFMAGSIGDSRHSWIEKMSAVDRKVVDWSNRIFQWIEIPATESFTAILQAAAVLHKQGSANTTTLVDRRVLAYFALSEWRDGRHLKGVAELVLKTAGKGTIEVMHLNSVIQNLESDKRLLQLIDPILKGSDGNYNIRVTD